MNTHDIPQANDLDTVRAVVRAVLEGHTHLSTVMEFTRFSKRHCRYRLHAARVLGLVTEDDNTFATTPLAARLLATPLHSLAERSAWLEVVGKSRLLQAMAPDLLHSRGPSVEELALRLLRLAELSPATAERRAAGLLAWRRRILDLNSDNDDHERSVTVEEPTQLDLF